MEWTRRVNSNKNSDIIWNSDAPKFQLKAENLIISNRAKGSVAYRNIGRLVNEINSGKKSYEEALTEFLSLL